MPAVDEAVPNPRWLRGLLVLEMLWWLGTIGWVAFFTLIVTSSGSPDWLTLAAVLALCLAASVANGVVLLCGMIRKSYRPVKERVGTLHGTVAFVAGGPPCIAVAGEGLRAGFGGDIGGAAGAVVLVALLVGLPAVGLVLSRADHRVPSGIGVAIVLLSCAGAALALFAVAVSAAVMGGMTA